MPWCEWIAMEVKDADNHELPPAELAAHVFWELTWHGYTESAAENCRDRLMDRIEELDRILDNG